METILKQGQESVKNLDRQQKACQNGLSDLRHLFSYYGSEEWFVHLDLDQAGELPDTLPRGVLSEDAIYNLLLAYRELSQDLRQLADAIDDAIG